MLRPAPTTAALLATIAGTLGLPVAAFFAPRPDGPLEARAPRPGTPAARERGTAEDAAQAASPSPLPTDPGVDL